MKANSLPKGQNITGSDCVIADNGKATKRVAFSEMSEYFRDEFSGGGGRPLTGIAMSGNLLRNSNFRRKSLVVNQRGEDVYEGVGYGIDGWKSTRKESVQTLEEDGWVIHDTDGGLGHYRQVIEEAEALNGVELTASVLVEIRTGGPFQIGFYSSAYHCPDAAPLSAGIHLLTYTETMTDITSTLQYFISPRATNAKIIACQLEPGNRQTLARKDAGGAWVLNNPTPNMALELLKCQRYFENGIDVVDMYSEPTIDHTYPFKVTKRAKPVCTLYSMNGTRGYISYHTAEGEWIDHPASISTTTTFGARVIAKNLPNSFGNYGFHLEANSDL